MRVLCLAAHPDDEVLGAGGTLLRHQAAGDATFLLVATVAHSPRWSEAQIRQKREECLAAARLLKLSDARFLEFPTMHLNTLPTIELNDAVGRVVAEWRPEIVYAPPCDDINRDHSLLFEAAVIAARPLDGGPRALYSYEIPTTTRFGLPGRWRPTTYVDISAHLEAKLAAMQVYQTELRQPPHPRSLDAIRAFARERGAAVGFGHAEAHMLVQELR